MMKRRELSRPLKRGILKGGFILDALEQCRNRLHSSIINSKSLSSTAVLRESQELDKLILQSIKRGGLFSMIRDCKECKNKGSEKCKLCAETSGGRPSQFEPEEKTPKEAKNG